MAKTLPPSMLSSFSIVMARLGLFSSANFLQIADVALRVVFLLFLSYMFLAFILPSSYGLRKMRSSS